MTEETKHTAVAADSDNNCRSTLSGPNQSKERDSATGPTTTSIAAGSSAAVHTPSPARNSTGFPSRSRPSERNSGSAVANYGSPAKRYKAELGTISGFIHKVSKIKGARKNVFDCQLQTANADDGQSEDSTQSPTTFRVVGFSPVKQKQLLTFEANHTAVEMRLKSQIDLDGKTEYVLSDYTEIKPTTVPFKIMDTQITLIKLDNLKNCALDVGYPIEGHVIQVLETEPSSFNILPKQEIHIGCKSNTAQVLLWGALCDTITVGQSYIFKNIKLRTGPEDSRFITTIPSTEIVPCETIEINEIAMAVQSHPTEETIIGKVVSISDVFTFLTCPTCERAIHTTTLQPTDGVVTCIHCKTMTLSDLCTSTGSLKVNIAGQFGSKMQLLLYSNVIDAMTAAFPLPKECESVHSLLKDTIYMTTRYMLTL